MLVYETHPFLEMFDPDSTTPHTPAFSQFKTQPHIESGLITYDGKNYQPRKKLLVPPSAWRNRKRHHSRRASNRQA